MANVFHANLTGADLHEPKGVAAANLGEVYVADGVGSGAWDGIEPTTIKSTGLNQGRVVASDGTGSSGYTVTVWKDLVGHMTPKTSGAGSPTLAAYRGGNVRALFYSAGDDGDVEFHLHHDYKPGSDLYLHHHWSHNGTAISGNIVVTYYITYAKGHGQAAFAAEKTIVVTTATPNIATIPQYSHRIEETQLSIAGGSATQLDSNLLEPDGVILVHYDVTTIPTITGGSPNEPAIHFIDLHYQADYLGTKNKSPDFYV